MGLPASSAAFDFRGRDTGNNEVQVPISSTIAAPQAHGAREIATALLPKTMAKKRVTKAKAKRAVTKKAPAKAPEPPQQEGDAAAETVVVE